MECGGIRGKDPDGLHKMIYTSVHPITQTSRIGVHNKVYFAESARAWYYSVFSL